MPPASESVATRETGIVIGGGAGLVGVAGGTAIGVVFGVFMVCWILARVLVTGLPYRAKKLGRVADGQAHIDFDTRTQINPDPWQIPRLAGRGIVGIVKARPEAGLP